VALLTAALLAGVVSPARALFLDDHNEMRLGMRAYTAFRISTDQMGGKNDPLTFPDSGVGRLRQNRYFLQLDFDHDLSRLMRTGAGFARPFGFLDLDVLRYSLQFRAEGEGLYQWGPPEFSNQAERLRNTRTSNAPLLGNTLSQEFITKRIRSLLNNSQQRYRLFLAYADVEKGPFFMRVGRQILAWGETDVFRLLDNINPLDDSFGGFFIPLDERRVPIEMVRASWQFSSFGPFGDVNLEGFAATGRDVATDPGIRPGSPWMPGGLGFPNPVIKQVLGQPDATDIRGGGRLRFNFKDATFQIVHYYTYLDVPGVQYRLPPLRGCPTVDPDRAPSNTPSACNPILAFQRFPRVPITGASVTFPIPSLYTIVRSEAAYFNGEPVSRNGQGNPVFSNASADFCPPGSRCARSLRPNIVGGLNPFLYPTFIDPGGQRTGPLWGNVLQLDTFNLALGLDVNRFVRFLNPHQSFFISTQFFYKHYFDSPGDLVLPVPFRNIAVPREVPIAGTGCGPGGRRLQGKPCKLQPRFFALNDHRFLQTLLVTTTYLSGSLVPAFAMFYDWQGPLLMQPGFTYIRDPFRFIFDYTYITGPPTAQIGAVRDRDNVRFQVEFVF
jgi:hypothetical protein